MPHQAQLFTRKRIAAATSATALAVSALTTGLFGFGAGPAAAAENHNGTATPIQHVVVIFQENVSFDHYFATYPKAANAPGETLQGSAIPAPAFTLSNDTPKDVDTLANAGLMAGPEQPQLGPARTTVPDAGSDL